MCGQSPYSTHELIAILLRGHEAKDLDYKASMTWDESDKRTCCAIVKDILAMANTLGGFIVVGVSEVAAGFTWDGVNSHQAESFDTTRLNRFLQTYTDPPINTLLRKVSHDGKTFVIIQVQAFCDTPHICRKEFPGILTSPTLYVRTDNNESAPLSSAADFKNVVERAVRNRSDALLASFRAILTSGLTQPEPSAREKFLANREAALDRFERVNPLRKKEPILGYLEATFFPDQFDSSRFTMPSLRAAAERAHVTYRDWPFLFIHVNRPECTYAVQDGLETLFETKDSADQDLLDFWRFQQSGLFFQRTTLRPTASIDPSGTTQIADLTQIAVYVAEGIDCLTRLYDGLLEETEYMSFLMHVLNTENRTLVNSWGSMPLRNPYTCRIPEILVERRLPLADWRAAIVDHALSIVNDVYLQFNWPQPTLGLAKRAIERTFARQW